MSKRSYPNRDFAWYNDDDRLAIVSVDRTPVSGERTTERYDTFQGDGSNGTITAFVDEGATILATCADHGIIDNNSITINSTADNFDDTYTITKVSKDTFRFSDASTPGAGETATWTSTSVLSGIRLTYHSKYEELSNITHDLKTNGGLDSSLHTAVLCYVKSRLFEDMGDLQKAQYFRQMYEMKVKKHRGRRSGVRNLSVVRL